MSRICDIKCLTLDKRVTIQSRTRVSDGQGGFTESWASDTVVAADIQPVKGMERYQAMQTQTPITHRIIIRYRSGVTTANRLLYGGRVLDIAECINMNEANAYLRITAIEKA